MLGAIVERLGKWGLKRVLVGCAVKWRAKLKAKLGITEVEEYHSVHRFNQAYPAERKFTASRDHIYALWWAGKGVFQALRRASDDNGPIKTNIHTLILPDPNNQTIIDAIDSSTSLLEIGSVDAIKRNTRNAIKLGINVFWYDGWPGEALTFRNPESEDGDLIVEEITKAGGSFRPVRRYEKRYSGPFYEGRWGKYRRLLAVSTPQHRPNIPSPPWGRMPLGAVAEDAPSGSGSEA